MQLMSLILRVLVASVFVAAGIAKLGDQRDFREAVNGIGIRSPADVLVIRILPIAELGIGGALLWGASARAAAVSAVALLAVFTIAMILATARGRVVDCRCFGRLSRHRFGWKTVIRNGVLAAGAGTAAATDSSARSLDAWHWITNASPLAVLAGVDAVVGVGVVAFLAWFGSNIMRQNGRIFARVERLESVLADHRGSAHRAHRITSSVHVTQRQLSNGDPAPEFDLQDLDGRRHSLNSLIGSDHRLLLLFMSIDCGPCQTLMPEIAAWQRRPPDGLRIAVVVSGPTAGIRAKAVEEGLLDVLVTPDMAVGSAFGVRGTPSAVLIDSDAIVASEMTTGAQRIRDLVNSVAAGTTTRTSTGSAGVAQKSDTHRPIAAVV